MTTKYQMVLTNIESKNGEDEIVVLGFTARKTKRSLYLAMMDGGTDVLKHVNFPDDDAGFEWSTKEAAFAFGSWRIRFSGVTWNDVFGQKAV